MAALSLRSHRDGTRCYQFLRGNLGVVEAERGQDVVIALTAFEFGARNSVGIGRGIHDLRLITACSVVVLLSSKLCRLRKEDLFAVGANLCMILRYSYEHPIR